MGGRDWDAPSCLDRSLPGVEGEPAAGGGGLRTVPCRAVPCCAVGDRTYRRLRLGVRGMTALSVRATVQVVRMFEDMATVAAD